MTSDKHEGVHIQFLVDNMITEEGEDDREKSK
jgi:hypothetical protein